MRAVILAGRLVFGVCAVILADAGAILLVPSFQDHGAAMQAAEALGLSLGCLLISWAADQERARGGHA